MNNLNLTINGEEFMCPRHGLDYRITCEDCWELWQKFNHVTREMLRKSTKDESAQEGGEKK